MNIERKQFVKRKHPRISELQNIFGMIQELDLLRYKTTALERRLKLAMSNVLIPSQTNLNPEMEFEQNDNIHPIKNNAFGNPSIGDDEKSPFKRDGGILVYDTLSRSLGDNWYYKAGINNN